jgi:pimeloyl-ACP methyl ester carboxylesterase
MSIEPTPEARERLPATNATLWNGFDVHVEDAGEGPPLVLLHSSGMSGDQWRRTTSALLQGGARTIVPDLLGSGRSAPWPEGEPFRFEMDVEVVDRLLRQIGRPVHLVGHSYGGHIALRAAVLDPSRVLSLALYDPVSFGVLDLEGDRDAFAEMSKVETSWGVTPADHVAWLRGFVEYWGGPEAWSRLREPARAEMMRVGWIVHAGARSLVADRTGAEAYRSIAAKTLLVTGERSPIAAGRIVSRLGEAIPGARVERFAGAGHMGPLTHVEAYNRLLAAHLA